MSKSVNPFSKPQLIPPHRYGYHTRSGLFLTTKNINNHDKRHHGSEPRPMPLTVPIEYAADEPLPWFTHKKRLQYFPEAMPLSLNVALPFYTMAVVYPDVWDKGRVLVCLYLRHQAGHSNYVFWWLGSSTMDGILAAVIPPVNAVRTTVSPLNDFCPLVEAEERHTEEPIMKEPFCNI